MKQTPMLHQYLELKGRHPDALLFFRLGDFYELFFEDAEVAAPFLGLVLTRRKHNDEVESPMCGVPHHALLSYVGRLVEGGHKVAIAEQVEDPVKGGGLVRREVVRVFTPGTVTEPELLGGEERRYLAAALPGADGVAVAFLETASGSMGGATVGFGELRELLAELGPRELLVREKDVAEAATWTAGLGDIRITPRPDGTFAAGRGEELLREVLAVGSLRAFELAAGDPLIGAAGAVLEYVRSTLGELPRHVGSFARRQRGGALGIDAASVRNLELLRSTGGDRRASLAAVLDATVTPMGARTLRDWLVRPPSDVTEASARLDAVGELVEATDRLAALREALRGVGDLERLAARAGLRQVRPAELARLRQALGRLPELKAELEGSATERLAALGREVDVLEDLRRDLEVSLAEEPPALLGPGTIRSGWDAGLDEARGLARGAKEVLGEIEARERQQTGIANLRVRYSRVFGYAFEVSRSNLERVPESWTRRQTLAGAERFVTAELEDLERRIASADERAAARERELYEQLVGRAAECAGRIAQSARVLAAVDVLASFADRARHRGYVRPKLVGEARIRLVASRHPVIEQVGSSPFVPNDCELGGGDRRVLILTGPNMGGKSTYLRQIALAVIMARAGSFVPAEEAEIGAIDRIFTRVGAGDDIARGESTFMVEMAEVAQILLGATPRSLVILDEVGRGTATFDGLSLAWAVVERLHGPGDGDGAPLVVFATHYHELTDLAERLAGVANVSVAVKEWRGGVVFLHRVVPGPADRSYGIHVARLAGVPDEVCRRAQEILRTLERQELTVIAAEGGAPRQMALFPPVEEIVGRKVRRLDLGRLTPLEALNILAELQAALGEEGTD